MPYNGIKEVRKMNGQGFIDDYKRCITMVEFEWANSYMAVNKSAIWNLAKTNKIRYMVIDAATENRVNRMIIY